MAQLVDFLQERGFENVSEAPGWATNGELSVHIISQLEGSQCHTVRIYAGDAQAVNLRGGELARATDASHNRALREAFEQLPEERRP